jgi:predicted nuclease of predicted toxin-antitoxin system
MQLDWEIWLDAHLSPIIAKWLKDKTSWNIKSAFVLKLSSLNDYEIYEKAKAHGNIILLSKDSDLIDIILQKGSPPKLINIKIDNCDNRILFNLLAPKIEHAVRMLTDFNNDIIEINLL